MCPKCLGLLFVQFLKDNSGSDFLLGKEHLFPANFSKISHKESKYLILDVEGARDSI